MSTYAFPKDSTGGKEETFDDGSRKIQYDDSEGGHHTIWIDKDGNAIEDVEVGGKLKGHRHYKVEFDASGNRTETEEQNGRTVIRTINKTGVEVESVEETVKPGKTAEFPTTVVRTTTKYDEKHHIKERIEEELTYMDTTLGGDMQPTAGKRKTIEYTDGKRSSEKNEKLDPATGKWVPR